MSAAVEAPGPGGAPALLLAGARTRLDPQSRERLCELASREPDWDRVVLLAGRHGVAPLLYRNLSTACPERVPPPILDRLQEFFRYTACHTLLLTGELLKLLAAYERARIPAIPYKGPILGAAVYGNLALRPFGDLDVLVRREDVLRAKAVAQEHGFIPDRSLTPERDEEHLRRDCEYYLDRGDGRVQLEIHWELVPRYFSFPLDPEDLWERLQPVTVAGREVRTLAAGDLLLFLCAHGCKHLWDPLRQVVDVAELVGSEAALDWDGVLRSAERLRSERLLHVGLLLASGLLDAPVPGEVLDRARRDHDAAALAEGVAAMLLRADEQPPDIAAQRRFHLKLEPRLRDKLRYCYRLLLTPTPEDRATAPRHGWLAALWKVQRPFRLAGKYGRQLLQRTP